MLAVLTMVKNEEASIGVTVRSIVGYFDTLIVYDTGSTDRTVTIIQDICKTNGIRLYLKTGEFTTFPESRNVALEFAETVPVQYLVLMDAGDEFRTHMTKDEFERCFLQFPPKQQLGRRYGLGTVTQKWLAKGNIEDHLDVRVIRNEMDYRYDPVFPVHERISTTDADTICDFSTVICLYQDRDKYGQNTKQRYRQDIELLEKAEPNKRNLYFLAQSYMSIDDYENGYRCNRLSAEVPGVEVSMNESVTYLRAGFCAIMTKMPKKIVFDMLKRSMEFDDHPIDPYIYIFRYCIERGTAEEALPYIDAAMKKDKNTKTLINHYFYDYSRWNLISIVCLMANQRLETGYECIQKIIHLQQPVDVQNMRLYQTLR
jgi:glycosyltransferase involved in cell wall biosynthesis